MKKLILTLPSVFLFILTSPIFAQVDPGDDPDVPAAPIDDYLWILVLIGFFSFYIFIKLRTKTSLK